MVCACGKLLPDVEKIPFQLLLFSQKLCVYLCVLRCIIIITCLQSDEVLECVCSRTYILYHYIVGKNYLNIVSAIGARGSAVG